MATVNPYLTFNGNCEAAFDFYKKVFGGEFQTLSRYKDMPPMPGMEIPADQMNLIMHVSLPIGKESILMASDANPAMGDVKMGQNISLSVNTENKEEADRIFTALATGGKITLPMGNMFWGAYFGMLIDPFDIIWMVNCDAR
jgi:PhnB protein